MNPTTDIRLVSRRGFLGSVISAGALVLGASVLPKDLLAADADNAAWHPSVYLGLQPDGTVIIVAHRSEMGTGIRSVLPQVAADELEADWKRVRVEQAIGDKKYGDQNTDGSCSIRDFIDLVRRQSATARLMLERSAAAKWGVSADECKAQNHFVVHKSGKKLGYGELASLAAKEAVPKTEDVRLKKPSEFRYIGKSLPTVDLEAHVTGKGVFGMDARMPGMVFASIERPPVLGGKLKSVDDTAAKQMKGVIDVVQLDGFKPPTHMFFQLGGVAVIADNSWTAMQARKKLKIEWDLGPNAAYESEAYKKSLFETARKPQKVVRNVGDVDAAFAKGGKILEAEYYVPMLAHAAMEPPAAVAEFKDGKVVAWAATQNPQAAQDTVAGALGIKPEDVTCHVTLLGGGFGRKSKPDYVAEAALLSKKVGKPVKVVWSREDDLKFDFYHSVAAMYMKASTDSAGKPTAWLQRSVFPSISSTFDSRATYAAPFEMAMGWSNLPFQIANHRAENGPAKNHVRIGWMRSVSNIYHAFAVHSFIDELAVAANRDRVEYLLEMIGTPAKYNMTPKGLQEVGQSGDKLDRFPLDTARLRNVIQLAADKSGWKSKKPGSNRALGIAAHWSFFTYVAAVVDVEVLPGNKLKIHRVDMAVDPGMVINPDRVKAQFEGAAVFGTSLALMGEITAADGKIVQSNFHNYPVARMNEAPRETFVHIVESTEAPAGVGEPGVPPIAPAITNAIFAATGKRIRELPIKKHFV